MINKWETGQIYVYTADVTYIHPTFDLNTWQTGHIRFNNGDFITLLSKPSSLCIPKGIPFKPSGPVAKVLTNKGEIFWIIICQKNWSQLSKNWLRKQNEKQ